MILYSQQGDFMKEKKPNLPQFGAGRKWAARLKALGQQPPPQSILDKINGIKNKTIDTVAPKKSAKDLDI